MEAAKQATRSSQELVSASHGVGASCGARASHEVDAGHAVRAGHAVCASHNVRAIRRLGTTQSRVVGSAPNGLAQRNSSMSMSPSPLRSTMRWMVLTELAPTSSLSRPSIMLPVWVASRKRESMNNVLKALRVGKG